MWGINEWYIYPLPITHETLTMTTTTTTTMNNIYKNMNIYKHKLIISSTIAFRERVS